MQSWSAQSEFVAVSGSVIPVFFSSKPSDDVVSQLLWMTLADTQLYMPLANVWLVVDGDARTARLATAWRDRLWRELGQTFNLLPLEENGGKLWAIRAGMRALLASNAAVQYIAIRDGDGDHAAADLPALLRTARYLVQGYGHSRCIATGARRSRHHPMGWFRGELESLLDQVTLDALRYALARQGRVINLRHCQTGAVPDLSSGYKVYGRELAEWLFVEHEPQFTLLSASDYWHFGPETCAVVETVLSGGVLGEVLRPTWDGQPTTSFGEFKLIALYGRLLAWVYARLDIPLAIATQFYDNFTPGMVLRTTSEGRELLDKLRSHALELLNDYRHDSTPIPPAVDTVPFV